MKRLMVSVATFALLLQVPGAASAAHRSRGGCAPACGSSTGSGCGYSSGGCGVQYQVSYQQVKRTVYESVPVTHVEERTATVLVPTSREIEQQSTVYVATYKNVQKQYTVYQCALEQRQVQHTVTVPVTTMVTQKYYVNVPEYKTVQRQITVMVPEVHAVQQQRTVCVMKQVSEVVPYQVTTCQQQMVQVAPSCCNPCGSTVCQMVPVTQTCYRTVVRCVPEQHVETYTVNVCSYKPTTQTVSEQVCSMRTEERSQQVAVCSYQNKVETVTVNVQVTRSGGSDLHGADLPDGANGAEAQGHHRRVRADAAEVQRERRDVPDRGARSHGVRPGGHLRARAGRLCLRFAVVL